MGNKIQIFYLIFFVSKIFLRNILTRTEIYTTKIYGCINRLNDIKFEFPK